MIYPPMHKSPATMKSRTELSLLSLALLLTTSFCGCYPPTDANSSNKTPTSEGATPAGKDGNAADTTAKAMGLLEECFGKYRNVKSYEDNATLRVRVPATRNNGVPIDVTENIRMAFERPNRLAMDIYNVKGCWTSTTWEALVGDQSFKPFGNQRLVRPLPDAIDLPWLGTYELPALLYKPNVGLPIQFELLLAEKPFDLIRGAESKFKLLSPESFDSALCDRVQIDHRGLSWVFWIDQKEKLLRRFEMPLETLNLPPMKDDEKKECLFAIELASANANKSIDWSRWQIPAASNQEVAVRKLIAPPQQTVSPIVGRVIEPFDLKDIDGNRIMDSAARSKRFSILCWLADDQSGESFCKDLMAAQREIEKQKLNTIAEIVLITQSDGKKMVEALKKWNCPLPLAVDKLDESNISQSRFLIQHTPSIAILDGKAKVQMADLILASDFVQYLPELVVRLRDGEDIADRQLQNVVDNQARYIAELHRSIIDKTQVEKLPAIPPFQFLQHTMSRDWAVRFDDSLIGAGGEQFYPASNSSVTAIDFTPGTANAKRAMTALDNLGNVFTVNSLGERKLLTTIPVEQADGAKRIHTLTDPWTHEWIAIVPEGLPRYWIVRADGGSPAETKVAPQFQIANQETVVAFAWTRRGKTSSLTIATSGASILTHDPTNDVVKNAKFDNDALAIIPGINAAGVNYDWSVVHGNRRLSKIQSLPTNETDEEPVTMDARKSEISFIPEPGAWVWGKNKTNGFLAGLAQLPTGETGIAAMDHRLETLWSIPLSVRPEQCRLLSSATLSDGTLYWLAVGPSRVIHLLTSDGRIADKASFGSRVIGAAIYPDGENLKLVVALESEVSCWSLKVPKLAAEPEMVGPAEKMKK